MNAAEQEIFDAALAIQDAGRRRDLLDRACAGNPPLRARLEELLSAAGPADHFFSDCATALARSIHDFTPVTPAATAPGGAGAETHEDLIGSTIGPYKLSQVIGEGGCGVVYLAEQAAPVRRRVALKIIKLGMDTKSVIARFEAEQQALAMMDHPNIAKVLDAGATGNGRPFFVMELVPGIRITEFCDQNNFDTRQRLELFIQVCHAIQHAHQKGIIHRDIKPSNILVSLHDGRPVPKVIDFGIAKAMEDKRAEQTRFTAHGLFIGTPAYMSPEQAQLSRLDVDTRSDVYSLGVLLYALLTGRTPFDQNELLAAGLDEMWRKLRDQEPPRPSAMINSLPPAELDLLARHHHEEPGRLRSELRGDLDWIVMKALEKDRGRRFETANALAQDVQRYLDNEPVMARPPSRLYRLQKLVRRNQAVFAAGTLAVLALAASTVVSSWLFLREREARQQVIRDEQIRTRLQQETEQLRVVTGDNQKFLKAAELFRRGQFEAADALLNEVQTPKVTPEYATMYRSLGDWHILNSRWQAALNRFFVLYEINESERIDASLDDQRYSVLLVDQGRLTEYERFRASLAARDAGTGDPAVAERVIRDCLLTPPSEELMHELEKFATRVQNSLQATKPAVGANLAAYYSYSLALMAYRQADYSSATNWCARAGNYDHAVQSRDVSVQLIQAMAHAKLGQTKTAQAELAAARQIINDAPFPDLSKAKSWQGYWFDWVCARIHLREAAALIEGLDEPNR
jgi:hypothetical protein